MFIENITFTSTQLNAGRTVATISGIVMNYEGVTKYYRVDNIHVANNSGATIHYVPMTDNEYAYWSLYSGISDYIPVANGSSSTLDRPNGKLTTLICSGVSGHSADVVFTIIKERE